MNTSPSVAQPLNPPETLCLNAITGEMMNQSLLHTRDDLATAMASARRAAAIWRETPIKERRKALLPVRRYLMKNLDELAKTIARDTGKTRVDAMATEVLTATLALGYYSRKAPAFLKPKRLFPGTLPLANKWSTIHRTPFGVVGIISPWNYPFSIPFSEVIMALLAGNAVILKTASETQATGLALARCLEEANLPEGLFTFINMPGREAGDAFLEAGVDKLFFTGSVPIGKKLMAKAAETLTPVSLELGGNDAMIVCEDADLDRAAAGAVWAGLQHAGQSCGAVERIYVHDAVYDAFLEKLKTRVETLRVGYDTNHNTDVGGITTSRQLDTVRRHVDDALERGATLYAQANSPRDTLEGNFYPPTVLTDVNHTMQVMKEETFGPLLGVMRVLSMDEAVKLANDSNLGLTGSIWTQNIKEGKSLARRIEAGAITINDHLISHGQPETPWGGFKESGIGRTHGALGFDEMTEPQLVVSDIFWFAKRNLWWHPFSEKVYKALKGVAQMLYGPGPLKRITGTFHMLRAFPRIFKSD